MQIFDISQAVFSAEVYPGDPKPQRERLCAMEQGDLYNLTAFSMCAHNGTHVDAPAHFIREGKTVEQLLLSKLVGSAVVVAQSGTLSAADVCAILKKAKETDPEAAKRILLKGDATVTADAAEVVLLEGLRLSHVPEGVYLLSAAPLLLEGADGAPCRAVLIKQ